MGMMFPAPEQVLRQATAPVTQRMSEAMQAKLSQAYVSPAYKAMREDDHRFEAAPLPKLDAPIDIRSFKPMFPIKQDQDYAFNDMLKVRTKIEPLPPLYLLDKR